MARAGSHPIWIKLACAGVLATLATTLLRHSLAGFWPWVSIATSVLALLALLLAARSAQRTHMALKKHLEATEAAHACLQLELRHYGELEHELLRAKQAAEAAALAKGEFLATMSHEIRTPLNGIIPMLELMAQGQLNLDQRAMLQTATESSTQLLHIVDDILDYSKLEAHKLELEAATFNLRELLEGVVQLMQRMAEGKQLRLTLDIDRAVRLPVRGDPVRLRQVLSNLIGNAIKFTERGGIDIQVRRLGETRIQHLLRFQIRDTGIGITAEQQARLFRSFSQADASTTRLYGGTGLGLAICKRIIDLMGGRIGVESERGRGATFWFEIPLLKVIGDLQQSRIEDSAPVLVISADERLAQRLKRLLESWNMPHQVVETAQEALERLRRHANGDGYRCVLADHDTVRYSARALHRALAHCENAHTPRLLWLYGEEPIPAGLQIHAGLVPRQSPDDTLRALVMPPEPNPMHSSAPVALTVPAQAEPAHINPNARILLVEDNPVNLLIAEKLLAALGYAAVTATDGEAALRNMQTSHYDLVFMDCQMPILDGYAATRRWRAIEAETGADPLPIVAMTANAMAGDRERCLNAGMSDYLSKPVGREQLDACLKRWLRYPPAVPVPASDLDKPGNTSQTTASATLATLDIAVIDELYEVIGPETLRILDMFLEDTPGLIEQLQNAAASHDNMQLRNLAHSLKSSSANVGAMALSDAARQIELAARTNTIDNPTAMVAAMAAEYARVRLALIAQNDRLLQRPPSGQDNDGNSALP